MSVLTLRRVKLNQYVVMFARVFNLVQADEFALGASPASEPALLLLHLALASALFHRKRKLGVNKFQTELAALIRLLECVCDSKLEVHGVGMREVFEEGQ